MSSGDIEDGPRPVLHHVAVGQEDVVVVQAFLVPPHVALINNGQICNVTPSINIAQITASELCVYWDLMTI